jgi:hypothetical protein
MDVTRWKEMALPSYYPLPSIHAAEGINIVPYLTVTSFPQSAVSLIIDYLSMV